MILIVVSKNQGNVILAEIIGSLFQKTKYRLHPFYLLHLWQYDQAQEILTLFLDITIVWLYNRHRMTKN